MGEMALWAKSRAPAVKHKPINIAHQNKCGEVGQNKKYEIGEQSGIIWHKK